MAEVETVRQRLRKADAEIAEAKRRLAEDERLLAEGKALSTVVERGSQLAARIEELHRRIQETQKVEVSNRETERTVQALEAELGASLAEIERLRVEREELAMVPCGGQGSYASCPKIRRAVEAGEKLPALEGRSRRSSSKLSSIVAHWSRLSRPPRNSPALSKPASGNAGDSIRTAAGTRSCGRPKCG